MDSLIQDSPGREERPITTRCSGDVEVKGDVGLDPQLATGTRLKQVMGLPASYLSSCWYRYLNRDRLETVGSLSLELCNQQTADNRESDSCIV